MNQNNMKKLEEIRLYTRLRDLKAAKLRETRKMRSENCGGITKSCDWRLFLVADRNRGW